MSKTGLGKGLSALIPLNAEQSEEKAPVNELEVNKIKPNSFQPRRTFEQDKLDELAQSLQEHGLVQPIVVRKLNSGKYELVVGERRLRASQQLGWEKIPAVVKELTDQQMMEIALIENIQRQNLNPIEEATAYKRLLEEFKLTQEQLAQRVSKSRSFIANMVRLLNLPQEVINDLSESRLTVGHARPLLALENEDAILNAAREIIAKSLSVRETEAYIKKLQEEKEEKAQKKAAPEDKAKEARLSPVMFDLEAKLRSLCGTKVKIKDGGGKGKIEIDYYSQDDLDRISSLILRGELI